MRKNIYWIVMISFIAVTIIDVRVYAMGNHDEMLNALSQIPYLSEVIEEFFLYNNVFSMVLFVLVKSLLEFIFGITTVSVFKNFIVQGAMVLSIQTSKVLLTGVIAYIIIVTIAVLFFASFVGFPIGAMLLLVGYIMVIAGKAALQVRIGHFLEILLKRTWHIYLDYLVGMLLLEIVIIIPFIGSIMSYVVIPIISIGIFLIAVVNKLIYKIYYPVDFNQMLTHKNFLYQQDIRKIVMQGINEEE